MACRSASSSLCEKERVVARRVSNLASPMFAWKQTYDTLVIQVVEGSSMASVLPISESKLAAGTLVSSAVELVSIDIAVSGLFSFRIVSLWIRGQNGRRDL